jgi:hypothetical protein
MVERPDCRRFLDTAVMTIAAGKSGMIGSADGWWAQDYFATECGRAGYDANRREFAKLLWKFNPATGDFRTMADDRVKAFFDRYLRGEKVEIPTGTMKYKAR